MNVLWIFFLKALLSFLPRKVPVSPFIIARAQSPEKCAGKWLGFPVPTTLREAATEVIIVPALVVTMNHSPGACRHFSDGWWYTQVESREAEQVHQLHWGHCLEVCAGKLVLLLSLVIRICPKNRILYSLYSFLHLSLIF